MKIWRQFLPVLLVSLLVLSHLRLQAQGQDDIKGPVVGVVRFPDGKPAGGYQVRVIGGDMIRTKSIYTDANGKFECDHPKRLSARSDSPSFILVRDPEHNLAAIEEIDDDKVVPMELKLAPALTLVGRAESGGKAVENPTATLIFWAGNTGWNLKDLGRRTSKPGEYEIPALPPHRRYSVSLSAPGYGQQSINNATGADTEPGTNQLRTVDLKVANLKLAGQVVDGKSIPVSGAMVYLLGEDQPAANCHADGNGQFTFEHVCEGTVRLSATAGTSHGMATANGGDTNVTIKVSESMVVQELQPRRPRRTTLKGKPLPDLAGVGLDTNAVPADKPVLLCLFDAGQRPSRAMIRQLQEQAASLKEKGITVAAVQANTISDETFNQWQGYSRVSLPVGRVNSETPATWTANNSALPFLILSDSEQWVAAEGFPIDELDAQLKNLANFKHPQRRNPRGVSLPYVFTQNAGPIRPTTATLNGMIVPNSKQAVTGWFQWGKSTNYEFSTSPQAVGSGTTVVRVSAPIGDLEPGGVYHYRLVSSTTDGTSEYGPDSMFTTGMKVIAWGGSGTQNDVVPVGLTNAVAVACGHGHSLALKADGTVVAWGGSGGSGRDPYSGYTSTKVPAGLSNVVAIAGGFSQSLAVIEDGKVVVWGEYMNHAPARAPEGLSNVIAVAAGDYHAIALKADGRVVAWGQQSLFPSMRVAEELSNVVAISSGSSHCIALRADGSIVEWGSSPDPSPEELGNVTAISIDAFTCLALQADGTVTSWGQSTTVPSGLNNVTAIAAGWRHHLALKADNTVTVWGDNDREQLKVPAGLCDVVAIACGDLHCLTLGRVGKQSAK